ncbi:MAG: cobalamin biosynthesis protein CobD [Acidimicrobiaceae bacterium]|nr:cobalamin biosynthesis protein CobD [Acidimicrobiaceae bacterium]
MSRADCSWEVRASNQMLGAATGLLLDRIFGEPPSRFHPVVLFGRLASRIEPLFWEDSRRSGGYFWASLLLPILVVGELLDGSFMATAIASYLAIAEKSLFEAAATVQEALAKPDLDLARNELLSLVGRDRSGLSSGDIARATVESIAENSVDAVVAVLFWASLLGAKGAVGYRAVNTLDSMFGNFSDRYASFGWTSAKLDDIANFLPARFTTLLVSSIAGSDLETLKRTFRQARPHPSPNAGLVETAYAELLDVELGGELSYKGVAESRPRVGKLGNRAVLGDIRDAVSLARKVDTFLASALLISGISIRALVFRSRGKVRR